MWLRAASQIFYSTGVGWGTLVAFASYNEHSHNFVRDAWLVPLINCATSFLAGLVVFSVVGYMAQSAGIEIADMQLAGPELAFVAYPQVGAIDRHRSPSGDIDRHRSQSVAIDRHRSSLIAIDRHRVPLGCYWGASIELH